MNINQMPLVMTGMEAAFTTKTRDQAPPEAEPSKFESVLRDKHNENAGKAEQKDAPESEVKAEDEAAVPEQEIPEDQYILAAAIMMQPRPEIVPVQIDEAPAEQLTPMELVPEAAAEETVPVQAMAETVPEAVAQETQIASVVPEENVKTEAGVPMSQEMAEPEIAADQPKKAEDTEIFQPVQKRDVSEKPQMAEKPVVKDEAGPETQTVRRSEEKPEEDLEGKGAWSEPVFGQTEAMPVKVAAPEKPVDLEAPDMVEQLSKSLTDAADKGLEQIRIHLTPEGLGELNVTITRLEGGALSIVLRAADPRAAALLQQNRADLQHTMANVVRDEVQIEVREPQGSPQQQLLNPDAEQGREQREQHRRQQDSQKQENDDFMQKLRLGLTDLTRAV